MANDGEVLRFSCDSCGTHLGVDASLAGTEAPCPKCGVLVQAPNPGAAKPSFPSSGVVRGVIGGAGGGFRKEGDQRVRRSGEEKRAVYSAGGRPGEGDDQVNPGGLFKVFITLFFVILVVVVVVWYLQRN